MYDVTRGDPWPPLDMQKKKKKEITKTRKNEAKKHVL